jgi:hypothetical protein
VNHQRSAKARVFQQTASQFQSFSHGAGVIAVAGGSGKPIPPPLVTGGAGVYAQGAEAQVFIDDFGNITGDIKPGPGVLGRGGLRVPVPGNVPIPPEVAAGVIGLAGDTAIPSISESGNTGVYGAGPIGVRGDSDKGNGGYFASKEVAQIHLEPHPEKLSDPNGQIEGRAGDLLVLKIRDFGGPFVTLWFCQFNGNNNWKQLA